MRYCLFCTLCVCLAAQNVPPSLTLREAVELAGTTSPTIQLARLRAAEAKVSAGIVASAYNPQLGAHVFMASETNNLAAIGINIPGFTSRLGPYRVFDARPVLSQTLLDLSLRSRMRAAREQTGGAKFDGEAIREEVQASVLELYLSIFEAESRIRAAQARMDVAAALADQTAKLESSGEGSKLDLARARMQREAEQVSLISARRDSRTLRAALLETIGLPPDASVTLAPPGNPNFHSPGAASTRPDIEALEARIRAAKLEEEAARRERLPKLSANASYGALGAGPDRALSTYSVGATLSVPIWTGGRMEGEIEAASLRVRMLEKELERVKLQAARETARSRIELASGQEAASAAHAFAESARQSLDLVRVRFGAGMATSVDVVTAQSRLAEAEELEIRSRYDAMLAKVRLAKAGGSVLAYFD